MTFPNAMKSEQFPNITGEKHYTIIKEPVPVEFECGTCGCVFRLPLKECDEDIVLGPPNTGYARDGYVAVCPECGAHCGIWKEDHEKRIKSVRKCEANLILETKD